MTVKTLLAAFLLFTLASAAAAQQVTTSQTSTGYFYPLGTSSFYTGCPNNGGTWHAGDGSTGHPGCYTWGYYHFGYDMFNSQTALYSPVFAMASGKVIYVDPNGSWSQGVTDNTAVFVSYSTSGGTNFVAVYGHLLRSSVKVQAGDVITGGTQIGQVGYWNPPHVHLGVWPNYTTLPPSPWGRDVISNYNNLHGTTDPVVWITSSGSAAKCQNGGTVRYTPNGTTPVHPQGTLFTVKDDPYNAQGTVYVLYNYQARPITSASVLYQLYGVGRGFDFRDVIQISRSEFYNYQVGQPVSAPLPGNGRNAPDGRLIQQWGSAEVSIVTEGGYRRPFASAEAFLNLGYQFCNVAGVSDYYSYPVGSAITQ